MNVRCLHILLLVLFFGYARQLSAQPTPDRPVPEEPEKTLPVEKVYDASELKQVELPRYREYEMEARAQMQYPLEARKNNIEGKVVVEFVVDTSGRAVQIRVVESSNPVFDAPAIAAVEKTEYTAASREGKKVSARMRVSVPFTIHPLEFVPVESTDAPKRVEGWKIDTVPQYDRQEFLRHIEYPAQARRNGIEGTVVVSVHIDWKGKVVSTLIESSDSPLLDDAARAAVAKSAFMPAYRGGMPVDAWISVPVRFVLQ